VKDYLSFILTAPGGPCRLAVLSFTAQLSAKFV